MPKKSKPYIINVVKVENLNGRGMFYHFYSNGLPLQQMYQKRFLYHLVELVHLGKPFSVVFNQK